MRRAGKRNGNGGGRGCVLLVVALLGGLVVWLVVLGLMIWRFGERDQAIPSDCLIVLGAAVSGAEPSPVFRERILHAIALHRRGLAKKIIFTGGVGPGKSHAESEVAASFAEQLGVAAGDLLTEAKSGTTSQNLVEARRLMAEEGLQTAIVVSDPLHLWRAMWMASDLGIEAVPSPAATSRYRSARTQIPFLLRELYFVHHYLVARQ